jgi:hypothetical protein
MESTTSQASTAPDPPPLVLHRETIKALPHPNGPFHRLGALASALPLTYVRREVLAGVTTGIAQIPEAVAFSLAAGVGPLVGLHATWIIGVITALIGARPGQVGGDTACPPSPFPIRNCHYRQTVCAGQASINQPVTLPRCMPSWIFALPPTQVMGAAGALAVVIVSVVSQHSVGHMCYTVILMGLLQVLFGLCKATKIMQLIPTTCIMGFCNGLGILIFAAQFHNFKVPVERGSMEGISSAATAGRRLGGITGLATVPRAAQTRCMRIADCCARACLASAFILCLRVLDDDSGQTPSTLLRGKSG